MKFRHVCTKQHPEAGMMGRKIGGIHKVGGPRSQVDTEERKSYKRGDVQKARKDTESAAGGCRPDNVKGKSLYQHQNTCTSTCLRLLYSNVDSFLNNRQELLVCLQLHKPVGYHSTSRHFTEKLEIPC